MILLITSTILLWAGIFEEKQPVILNFIEEMTLILQVPTEVELIVREERTALAELVKSEGNVTVKELPDGVGF